jgi:hypothetical protein
VNFTGKKEEKPTINPAQLKKPITREANYDASYARSNTAGGGGEMMIFCATTLGAG